jgi:hypothetical protein
MDDLGFVGNKVETCHPSPKRLAYIMIAIGGTTQDADDSRVSGMPFAAAAAFQNLRPFVFRYHPLHL